MVVWGHCGKTVISQPFVTLYPKSSLILGENKAALCREGQHMLLWDSNVIYIKDAVEIHMQLDVSHRTYKSKSQFEH